ncbi:MAG: hypothetical protein IAE82_05165 [Opitutaceae bacterium]|nr:hypothetical protein [Opitutaceae bacterium]
MEQLSQSPFFPVPVRWFEIPMQTARWGLGQLAQSTTADTSAEVADPLAGLATKATATSTDANVAPESELTSADTSTDTESPSVGVLLNEYA